MKIGVSPNSVRRGGCMVVRGTLLPRRQSIHFTVRAGGNNSEGTGKDTKAKWDLGRFVKTLWFFNKPSSPFGFVKDTLAFSKTEDSESSMIVVAGKREREAENVVVVAGATGGVGKRVVTLLLSQGRHVRALVRDIDKAKSLYAPVIEHSTSSGCLELAPADITQAKTLLPEYFTGVKQLVWCAATKIVPKEGDTEDRQKYYQGIKFYDPEVAGDTPESVEYNGMRNVLNALQNSLPKAEGIDIFNPAVKKDVIFGAIDDVVMGGASSSMLSVSPLCGEQGTPAGIFAGNVTQANNGGFASVRSKNFTPSLDVSAYDGFEMRVKGDGQRYKFIARTEDAFDGVGYTCSFDTKPGTWQTIRIPFDKLIPVFRAKIMRDGTKFNRHHVSSLQLMLSKFEYDGQLNPSWSEGPFELPIQYIKTYVEDPTIPRCVIVSSAGVTRPGRPGINVEEEPPAVKMNDMLGGLLTFKEKGEDVVRESGIPYAIVRPVALTEEPAGAELELDQGDTIKGKISRDDIAELCVALLEQKDMSNVTFEIKSTVPFSTPFEIDPSNPPPPREWGALLRSSNLKPHVTGKTIDGVYTGKEKATV